MTALRSGKYPQTRCTLADEDGFCCLGVLCDIVNPNAWEQYDEDGILHWYGETKRLPDRVMTEAGILSGSFPTVLYYGKPIGLHELNDSELLTFNDIADLIEQQYEEI